MQRKRNTNRLFYVKVIYAWFWFAVYLALLMAIAEIAGILP